MLIYSGSTVNEHKNARLLGTGSILNSEFEVKTSKGQKNLSKKNINFLVSLGFNLKKKK